MRPTLGFLVQHATTVAQQGAADAAFLDLAARRGWGTLRLSCLHGDVLALGRYHLAPAGAPGVELYRRQSGGRVAAAGSGFVHIGITLPHRSALVSDDPFALGPEQVLNRAVRGLLGGLEHAGLAVLYPGRDTVTAAGRPLAILGFEIDARGATLIDMVLSVERDQSLLPRLLDRADPEGAITAPMTRAEDVTSIVRQGGRAPDLDEIAAWVRHGYETRLGVRFVDEGGLPPPAPAGTPVAPERRRRAGLERRGVAATMLGVVEAHCARAGDGTLDGVLLAGDLLAPSGTIARLEDALRGCVPEVDRLQAVIHDVVRPPHAFILGVGPLRTIAEAIARAMA